MPCGCFACTYVTLEPLSESNSRRRYSSLSDGASGEGLPTGTRYA